MDYARRMVAGANRLVEERRVRVEGLGRGLPDPARLLEEKTQRLDDRAERLGNAMANLVARREGRLAEVFARLPHPGHVLRLARQRFAPEAGRLDQAWQRFCKDLAGKLETFGRVLESTSYRTVLRRGFAVVHGVEGPITRAAGVTAGLALELEFADGRAQATGDGGSPAKPKKAKTAKPSDDGSQGTLL
jgi:exodeoxyribonuclease VII large subunit